MKNTIDELESIVDIFSEKIRLIPAGEFAAKPLPGKWSKKEVLGHLVDSAQNNIRRFICGQYEKVPSKIVYEQDFWVAANGYQNMDQADIVALWKLINQRVAEVLRSMPQTNYLRQSDTGRQEAELHSLEWLAEDYVKHMKHHLNQIIAGSFKVTYP